MQYSVLYVHGADVEKSLQNIYILKPGDGPAHGRENLERKVLIEEKMIRPTGGESSSLHQHLAEISVVHSKAKFVRYRWPGLVINPPSFMICFFSRVDTLQQNKILRQTPDIVLVSF